MKKRDWSEDIKDILMHVKNLFIVPFIAIGYILVLLIVVPIRTIASLVIIFAIIIFDRHRGNKVANFFDKILEPLVGFIDR